MNKDGERILFIARMKLDQKGLTLIELLAVIVILGIVASIAVISIGNVIQGMKDKAFVGNAYALKEAAHLYISQEKANGNSIEPLLTYEILHETGMIERFKDPDTGNYPEPSSSTFVLVDGKTVSAVCVVGEKRSLCEYKGSKGIPISELSPIHITINN